MPAVPCGKSIANSPPRNAGPQGESVLSRAVYSLPDLARTTVRAVAGTRGGADDAIMMITAPFTDMVWVPGGTFRMGSDKHYPEERPVHRVAVDGFWMDRAPVTNERFRQFVEATGHVTYAEIPPKAEDYPGALPDQLFAGSLVFIKPDG